MKLSSISSKFNLLSIFLILLTSLATGGFVIWHYQTDTLETFKQHGIELAEMLAENIEYGVYTENQQVLKKVTQGLKKNRDITYIAVFNEDNTKLYDHLYKAELRVPLLGTSNILALSQLPLLSSYINPDNNDQYLDIIVPVYITSSDYDVYDSESESESESEFDNTNHNSSKNKTELIGFLQLGLSEEQIYQRTQHFIVDVLTVVLVIILFGILITLWLTRRITAPIHSLLLSTEAISRGEFSGKIKVKSNDEMGVVAKSFNKMAGKLEQYQIEVSEQHNRLEQQVIERTHKLQTATDEAIQLTQKTEAASLAKSQFLSNMSHELRTPLNSVIGFTELMKLEQENNLQGLHSVSIEQINLAGNHLLSLVDDILDFSKIEAGKLEIENSEFEIAQLLNETTTLFTQDIKAKNLQFEILCTEDVPAYVRGDFKRIKQILINLISNAIKFTLKGQLSLQLSCIETIDDCALLHFKITDTGIGISQEQQAIIFNSFSQADISITRTYGGTGLGLSIVKQLIELMEGEVGVNSELGIGSTFWFKVSLKKINQLQLPFENERLAEHQFSAHILVAEDFQVNQMLIARFLEHYGCTVDLVDNGQLAINAFQANEYDLVFMDCQMPILDGYTATQQIRHFQSIHDNKKHIPIIALTAHALVDDHKKCLSVGMDYVITKPFSRNDLYYALAKWLSKDCIKDNQNVLPISTQNHSQEINNLNEIKVIDVDFLQKNFNFDNEADLRFIERLTTIFQQNGKDTLLLLQKSINEKNIEEITGYAHDLKSICANVGAIQLTKLCKKMEQLGAKNNMSQAVILFTEMEIEFSLVIADLLYINKLKN